MKAKLSPPIFDSAFSHVSVEWSPEDLALLEARAGDIPVPEQFTRAVPKRKAEFLAGRICAGEALSAVGCRHPVGVPAPGSRAPVWPRGYIGSITHTRGFASAVVARCEQAQGLGLDSECVMGVETCDRIQSLILSESERQRLARPEPDDPDRETMATLLFSVKESTYKCLHPIVEVPLRFQSVELETLDCQGGLIRMRFVEDVAGFHAGDLISGRWAIDTPFVHTGVVLY